MNIIIPMAGMGKRMRPHTLTIPKPLIPIAGKPIVQRLVEDIAKICGEKIEEIAFVIGDFGKETEERLLYIADKVGAKGRIFYQEEPLGTAHAILCARECLNNKVVVAFADTLFSAQFKMDTTQEGIIWVHRVDDPSAFGVVKLNEQGEIIEMVEKPKEFVSDLAIIGIYYFKDGANLEKELQYLIDNNIKEKGEYQLTNALVNMKNKGLVFKTGKVDEWLDCGNKDATVYTNQRILELVKDSENLQSQKIKNHQSVIIEPCFIGQDVELYNSVIGPHVSVGSGTIIRDSVVRNSIIQQQSLIQNAVIENSMIGNYTIYKGNAKQLSLGDYSVQE
ncbi:MAG: sugar phosphate nucleotidyltransferase [Flavobacteriales bacterium]|nr:sugar phosphate nucleotidyltransferase [Flavobacteriales bacterium]